MKLRERVRTWFTPKRGVWEGALFGVFLGWLHSFWGPAYEYFVAFGTWCNFFFILYLSAYAISAHMIGWQTAANVSWLPQVLAIGLLGGLLAGIWMLLKSRFFWLGFMLLMFVLLSLLIPVRIPAI